MARASLAFALVVLLAYSAGQCQAQPSPVPPTESGGGCAAPAETLLDGHELPGNIFDPRPDGNVVWASAEYLLWWLKGAPALPAVTTGDPTDGPLAGTFGQSGTRVLFGGDADFGAFSGGRVSAGGWLAERSIGLEGSGFLLERRSAGFAAASDATGQPPLYVPAFNTFLNRQDRLLVSDPLTGFAGGVALSSAVRLWGAEVNGVVAARPRPGVEVQFLAGFRYLDLMESFQLQNTTQDLILGNTTVINDRFDTRNQFYGGQLGTRLGLVRDRLSADVGASVALGSVHQVVGIQGSSTQFGPGAVTPGSFESGFFAQPSNIGRRTEDRFAVVPEVRVGVGYDFLPGVRAFVGYDWLYWSSVVRPGSQIDRQLDQGQNPILRGPEPAGPGVRPAPQFNRTDFWAQGLTFGLLLRY
jgi:hypothetical protein